MNRYVCAFCRGPLGTEQGCSCRDQLNPLHAALRRARALHPEGASFGALVSEVRELAWAILFEHHDRVKDEALDVTVVALRYALGERVGGGR